MSGARRAALFVTCLVDLFLPEVGEAIAAVLGRAGVRLTCPPHQTCCGLPLFNNGYREEARRVYENAVRRFPGEEPVLVPSGSCAWMLRVGAPELYPPGSPGAAAAAAFALRVYEFSEFFGEALGCPDLGITGSGRVTYHASCHLLRGLRVADPPRQILRRVRGVEFVPLDQEEECCGFGGTFAVKLGAVSTAVMKEKLASVTRSGARILTACDAGCLIHLRGGLARARSPVRAIHLAELMAEGLPR